MTDRELAKYLRRAGEYPELRDVDHCAVVIPAWQEQQTLPGTLDSLDAAARESGVSVSVIVVVNHPAGSDPHPSEELLSYLNSRPGGAFRLHTVYAPDLSDGVGRARKLGMDGVVAAFPAAELEKITLFSLDADSPVAPEYFSRILRCFPGAQAAVYGIRHRAEAGTETAIRRYEEYLERYVTRLRKAGSPYAMQTIGSAFAVRGDAYVRAGGMKVRQAGEDFYFLQALAKQGKVEQIPDILVYPSARPSQRVPFGTGPAVRKLMEGGSLDEIPDAPFAELQKLLSRAAQTENLEAPEAFLMLLSPPAAAFLEKAGFLRIWPGILRNVPRTPEARLRAFHTWFDGLKTLRFLHALS